VRFRTGIHVGYDLEFEALHRNSHAVVLAGPVLTVCLPVV